MTTTDLRGVMISSTDPTVASNPNPDLAIKAPCIVATTGANIVLSGLQAIDGYTTLAGDRVLVKDQADPTTNGIYNAATGNWTRAYDAQSNTRWAQGTWVLVTGGSVNANVAFAQTTPGPIVLGTTDLVFVAFPFADLMASMIGFVPLGTGAVRTTVDAELKRGHLHSKDFGAAGDGTTDDTATLQAWLNACSTLGIPGFLDTGSYFISSALTVTNSNGISIFGPEASPGNAAEAKIVMGSLTQDGIQFDTTGRICLKGFGIVSSGIPTAGAALNFQGSRNQTVGGSLRRLDLGFGTTTGTAWNGIVASGLASFTIDDCSVSAQNICAHITSPGDSEIHNCLFTPLSANAGGLLIDGDPGGLRVISNKFNSGISYLYGISVSVSITDGDLFIIGNSIEGVIGQSGSVAGYGIIIDQIGGQQFGNVIIIGNEVACGNIDCYAIWVNNTTVGWLQDLVILGNVLNSNNGVSLHGTTNFIFNENVGGGLTLTIDASCSGGIVSNNILAGLTNNSTSIIANNNLGLSNTTPTLLAVLGDPTGNSYSVSSLSFTGFNSSYNHYLLVFDNICPDTNAVHPELLQRDGGSFQTTIYANASGGATGYVDLLPGSTVAQSVPPTTKGYGISGTVTLQNANGGNGCVKVWQGQMTAPTSGTGSGAISVATVAGMRNQNSSVTGFKFQFSAGNICQGSISVYGVP